MKSSIISELRNQLKKISNDKNIIDIIIFGSVVKEKDKINDIDIAIIFKEEDYKNIQYISSEIKNSLRENNLHIEPLIINDIFKEPLYLTLIHEGFSIKQNTFINEAMKTRSMMLVTYDLRILNHSKKTLFGYALKGRKGQSGFIDEIKGNVAGRNNILVPT